MARNGDIRKQNGKKQVYVADEDRWLDLEEQGKSFKDEMDNTWVDDKKAFHCITRDGKEWISPDGKNWEEVPQAVKLGAGRVFDPPATGSNVRVPKKSLEVESKHDDSLMSQLEAQLCVHTMESPWGDLPPTQQKIHEIMGAMKDLLLYKNQKYGDSAINPKKIFYKGDSTNSILIRLDDKLGRVMSNTEEKPRTNDVCDIIGYCVLLLISMGVTKEDIEKFKD